MVDIVDGIKELGGNVLGAVSSITDQVLPKTTISDVGKNVAETIGGVPNDRTFGQSSYDFTSRVFPSDLGSTDYFNGHYVVFNINEQTSSKMGKISTTTSGLGSNEYILSTQLGDELSKTDMLRFNMDRYIKNSEGRALNAINSSVRPRFTRRIKESIALYMPNSELTFTDAHDFENISLTKFGGSVLSGGGRMLAGVAGIFGGAIINNLVDAAGGLAGTIGNVAQVSGAPVNPKVEVLFANTFQREFSFDFLMAPSNEKESEAIKQIIKTFRFHAAPELRPGFVDSFFWVPPAEFDITFYHFGKENTHIPRINTCVLKQIDVSYAPTGVYSTFSNGYPVQVRLMLRFTETEVVHKTRVIEGF